MTGEWLGTALPVALLLALATAVLLLPARRERPATGRRRQGALTAADEGGPGGGGAARTDRTRSVADLAGDLDIGLLLTEVATLLRTGATPQRAWERTLGRAGVRDGGEPGGDGVPPVLRALAEAPVPSWLPQRVGRTPSAGSGPGAGRGDAAEDAAEDGAEVRVEVSARVARSATTDGSVEALDHASPDRGGDGAVRRRGSVLRGWTWRPPLSRSDGVAGRSRPGPPRGLPVADPAAARRVRAARAAAPGAIAACRLTAELGAPLAGILETVADGVAEAGHADSSRRTALSGPRTTARLLACLPLLGLALGQAVGAHPSEVLLDGGWGSALGLLGIGLMALGQLLTARLVRAAEGEADDVDEALVLDLAGAALRAGASLPGALQALGAALDEESLAVVGRALLLGASWDAAWRAPEDPRWRKRRARLEQSLRPGWEDGASPGPLLAGTARALRAGRASRDEEAAERLAVRLVVPLGLCFLPAFVLLGIVPVIAGVGLDLLAA